MTPSLAELESASTRVHELLPPTPQFEWPLLSRRAGCSVWVKHENHLPVGAFKVRGGLVYLDWLRREHPEVRGVIAATRGNHGQSVAFAAARHGLAATLVVPHGNSREKNAAMQALGATLIEHGNDFQDANEQAVWLAGETGFHRVPSFHPLLVLGVATGSLEFLRGSPELDAVYVPIGMGSGICAMIAARDALGLKTEIVGVVSDGAPAFSLSHAARRVVTTPRALTFVDGVGCRSPESAAVETACRGASRVITVADSAVAAAMVALYQDTHNLAEPAGAIALAGLLSESGRLAGKRAGFVLSGGNVDREIFQTVLAGKTPPP